MHTTPSEFAPERYRPQLLSQARAGWSPQLRGECEPSDLVQEVLLEAIREIQKSPQKAPVAVEGWLRRMLRRNLLDKIRYTRRKKRNHLLLKSIEPEREDFSTRPSAGQAQEDPSPSARAMTAEQLKRLRDCLVALPPDQAAVVDLHYLNGKSIADTALEMGRTVPAVAGLLRRGLEHLRQLMNAMG